MPNIEERGTMQYNFGQNRYGIWDGKAYDWFIEGLHCGMCFDVFYGGRWVPTRIEMADDWYLVGLPRDVEMRGLRVRMA